SASVLTPPALMVIDVLVFAVLVFSVTPLFFTVAPPALRSTLFPYTTLFRSAVLPGNTAAPSVDVIPIVWITVVTRFQFVSTAFTAALNTTPPHSPVDVVFLPVALHDTAVSPGTNSCSFVKVPAFTVMPLWLP